VLGGRSITFTLEVKWTPWSRQKYTEFKLHIQLGRDLRHLVNTVQDLSERGGGFKVLTGQGAEIDTTATASGKLIFGICASLVEFERELISFHPETLTS
jgi:hypothetical protein